jgi:hypothetical protein
MTDLGEMKDFRNERYKCNGGEGVFKASEAH